MPSCRGISSASGRSSHGYPTSRCPTALRRIGDPIYAQLQAAARQGVDVEDLDAAAEEFAHVVLSCGTCHDALDRGPVYPAPAPDEGDSAI